MYKDRLRNSLEKPEEGQQKIQGLRAVPLLGGIPARRASSGTIQDGMTKDGTHERGTMHPGVMAVLRPRRNPGGRVMLVAMQRRIARHPHTKLEAEGGMQSEIASCSPVVRPKTATKVATGIAAVSMCRGAAAKHIPKESCRGHPAHKNVVPSFPRNRTVFGCECWKHLDATKTSTTCCGEDGIL